MTKKRIDQMSAAELDKMLEDMKRDVKEAKANLKKQKKEERDKAWQNWTNDIRKALRKEKFSDENEDLLLKNAEAISKYILDCFEYAKEDDREKNNAPNRSEPESENRNRETPEGGQDLR